VIPSQVRATPRMSARRPARREHHGRPGSVLRLLARAGPFPASRVWIQAVRGALRLAILTRRLVTRYFDNLRHSVLLEKIAKRVQDPRVLHLVKQIIKASGNLGVPQGGPFSPLAANLYLNEVDWHFEAIRRKTAEGPFEAVNYHRFADDIVITVSGHSSKRGWAERVLQRLQEQLEPLGV